MAENLILKDISKSFDKFQAVKKINLNVNINNAGCCPGSHCFRIFYTQKERHSSNRRINIVTL